ARDRLERGALAAAGLLLAAIAPMNLVRFDAVFVLQHAAHPDHRCDLIFRQPDSLAAQVFRFPDASVGADIDARVPEDARNERRNPDIGRRAGCRRTDEAGERQVADVELFEFESAVEDLLWIERQVVYVAPLDLHAAVYDRLG